MKRESQNDLRYIKTESLIQNTFKAMLLEMDYSLKNVKNDNCTLDRKSVV